MRLFIAINFNADTRLHLIALRDELPSNSRHGRFSAPENLHLTLAFLGECSAAQTTAAKAILDMLTFEPFAITIDSVGRFKRDGGKNRAPTKSRYFVGKGEATGRASFSAQDENEQAKSASPWWAGFQDNAALSKLQSELTTRVRESGFALENRRYHPHVTLGREVVTGYVFGKTLPFGETVASVELMKSERIGGKLTYTEIYRRTAHENNP